MVVIYLAKGGFLSRQLPPIDDDIYEFLQAAAVPLEDDINSVLRRLLGLTSSGRPRGAPPRAVERPASGKVTRSKRGRGKPGRSRVPKGSILQEGAYELPILRALHELGGKAPSREVIDRTGELLDGKLTAVDHETLDSGDVRWRNRAQFVRLSLIKKGDMKADSPRGVWEISVQGADRLKKSS
jgi:Mrr N-terminal domain